MIDLGILGAGGVSGGIHPEQEAEPLGQVLRDAGCARAVRRERGTAGQGVARARPLSGDLRRIVIIDMKGLRDFADPMCESLSFSWDAPSTMATGTRELRRSPTTNRRCCFCRAPARVEY